MSSKEETLDSLRAEKNRLKKENERLATKLQAAEKAFEQHKQVSRRQFRGLAHDFNNAISAIAGHAELTLLQIDDLRATEQNVRYVILGCEQISRITTNMLLHSQLKCGRLVSTPCSFSVHTLFSKLRAMYSNNSKDIAFQTKVDPSFPTTLSGDATHLERILQNLIWNAFKFTYQGSITLEAQYDPNSCVTRFSITDTGKGIPKQHQTKIFKSFYQVREDHEPTDGFGLGLSVVIDLLDLLDGNIHIESEVGAGTTFHIDVPFAPKKGGTGSAL